MATVIAEIYNTFPSVDESIDFFEPHSQILVNLGELLVKYNLHKTYRVQLIHKHFKINDDEIVVEVDNGDKRLTMPWKKSENGEYIMPRETLLRFGMDPSPNGRVVPHAWVFKNSYILPYEYKWDTSNSKQPIEQNDLPTDLVQKIYNELKARGLHTSIGIISTDDVPTIEQTYSDIRANLYIPITEKNENPESGGVFVDTQWLFEETPIGINPITTGRCYRNDGKHGGSYSK